MVLLAHQFVIEKTTNFNGTKKEVVKSNTATDWFLNQMFLAPTGDYHLSQEYYSNKESWVQRYNSFYW